MRPIALAELRELDEPVDDTERTLTWRAMVEHVQLIDEAELSYPIILAADGAIMDGRHRAAMWRAVMLVALLLTLVVWRCPRCGEACGKRWRVDRCPHCWLELERASLPSD